MPMVLLVLALVVVMAVQLCESTEQDERMQIAVALALLVLVTTTIAECFDAMQLVLFGSILVATVLHPVREQILRSEILDHEKMNRVLVALVVHPRNGRHTRVHVNLDVRDATTDIKRYDFSISIRIVDLYITVSEAKEYVILGLGNTDSEPSARHGRAAV